MKEWFLAKDIAGISGLPSSPNSVTRLATQKGWTKRQVQGAKGVTFEYHISSLPPETQQQLKLKAALAAVPQKEVVEKKPDADLMQRFNQATDAAREKAKSKAEAVLKLQSCLDLGIPLKQAIPLVAEQKAVSPGSLKNWYYKVCGNPVHEWQALLISGSGKTEKAHKKAFIEQEAWEVFLADYLRPEEPELRACYRRTAKLAQFYGWQMASLQTFQRKLAKEIPYEVILLKRKTDRKTELCQHDKELSFDKVWERDYAPSNVRQASQDQLRILFLQSESVRIKKNGEFTLKAAGKLLGLTNIYWAQDLFGIEAKRVVVRFDPDNLHSNVYVYDLDGRFLAEAVCREAKGYGDTRAAREQGRYYKQIVTSAKKQAESLDKPAQHNCNEKSEIISSRFLFIY